jgi:hypothetical protein
MLFTPYFSRSFQGPRMLLQVLAPVGRTERRLPSASRTAGSRVNLYQAGFDSDHQHALVALELADE